MANLSDIRDGVVANVNTYVTGLPAFGYPLGTINPPCAIVLPDPGTFIDWLIVLTEPEPSEADYTVRVVILVSTGVDPSATALLDSFLTGSGPTSVRAAIAADPTLGGIAESAQAVRAQRYGLIEWGGISYLGAEVIVEVMAS